MRRKFYAISYNKNEFEASFEDVNIPVFPHIIQQPESKKVITFPVEHVNEILNMINLSVDDIDGYIATERENVTLLSLKKKYEFNNSFLNSTNGFMTNGSLAMFNELAGITGRDIVLSERDDFSSVNNRDSLLLMYFHNNTIQSHTRLLRLPDKIEIYPGDDSYPVDVIKQPDYNEDKIFYKSTCVGSILGNKVIIGLFINSLSAAVMEEILKEIMPQIAEKIGVNSCNIERLKAKEKGYAFTAYLDAMFESKQYEYKVKLESAQKKLSEYSSALAIAIREEKELRRLVAATDLSEERVKFMKELNSIKSCSEYVRDIDFSGDGIIIHLRHIYFKTKRDSDMVIHCGEIDLTVPFDLSKHITAFRIDNPKDMRYRDGLYPHPNVFQNGEFCLGDLSEEIPMLRASYELGAIFTLLNGFLHTYNPGSPTMSPDLFPSTSVEEAEAFVRELYKDEKETFCGAEVVSDDEDINNNNADINEEEDKEEDDNYNE